MKLAHKLDSFTVATHSDAAAGVRNLLRETFCRSVDRGEYPTAWSLRVGFIDLIKRDTYLVLGYEPEKVESFLGLPILICAAGSQNRLVTATGSMAIPENDAVRWTTSRAKI